MSRLEYFDNGATYAGGYDKPLGIWFLQVFEDDEEDPMEEILSVDWESKSVEEFIEAARMYGFSEDFIDAALLTGVF